LYEKYYYSSWDEMCDFVIREIVDTLRVNGKLYFQYQDSDIYECYRDNILYKRVNTDSSYIQIDFNQTTGSTFYGNSIVGEKEMTIIEDIKSFHGERTRRGYQTTEPNSYEKWIDGIGYSGYYYFDGGWPYGSNYLVLQEALLFSDSGSVYYNSGYFPEIDVDTIYTADHNVILIVDPFHKFDFEDEYRPYSFIDVVDFEYYFEYNGSVFPGDTLNFMLDNPAPFEISFEVYPPYMAGGFNLKYRFKLSDKAIIPNRIYIPSDGWLNYKFGAIVFVSPEGNNLPSEFSLKQNYPNPFNPETKISYSLKEAGNVELIVYDVLGNEVAKLVNEQKPAGSYEVAFNATNLPSGVYIYRIKSGEFTESKKMILLK